MDNALAVLQIVVWYTSKASSWASAGCTHCGAFVAFVVCDVVVVWVRAFVVASKGWQVGECWKGALFDAHCVVVRSVGLGLLALGDGALLYAEFRFFVGVRVCGTGLDALPCAVVSVKQLDYGTGKDACSC